jgi:hypothetical protein
MVFDVDVLEQAGTGRYLDKVATDAPQCGVEIIPSSFNALYSHFSCNVSSTMRFHNGFWEADRILPSRSWNWGS